MKHLSATYGILELLDLGGDMDEKTDVTENEKPVKSTRGSRKKTILMVLLVLILIGAAAGAAYWWRDMSAKEKEKQQATDLSSLQQKNTKLEKELADKKTKNGATPDETACTSKSPSAAAIGNIEASITSGNTAALEGYMASSVNVIIAASEGLGMKTPTEAVSGISTFITNDPASWDYDFDLSASLVGSYSKGFYGQYFPDNAVAAKASNQKVISFSFDCDGKISTVFLAANADLL